MKQKMFGASSEKRKDEIPGQVTLFDDFGDPLPVIEPEYIEVKEHTKKRKSKATYDEMFSNLPHKEVFVDTLSPDDKICPECGTDLVPIGHEKIRTEVVFTPAKLEVIDYISTTYSCPKCKKEATEEGDGYFIKDKGKPALISGSYASESLVAWTMGENAARFLKGIPEGAYLMVDGYQGYNMVKGVKLCNCWAHI